MRKTTRRGVATLPVCAALAVALTGCSDRLLRENVLATTNSVIGVQIAQNAKTQLYELKAGYARSEFFLVPTGKRVVYSDNDGSLESQSATAVSMTENDPTLVPDVLAEIQVGGSSKNATDNSVHVYQRLAVGKNAVLAPAAIALYAQDATTAKAVARAVAAPTSGTGFTASISAIRNMQEVLKNSDKSAYRDLAEGLDSVAKRLSDEARSGFQKITLPVGGPTLTAVNGLAPTADFAAVLGHLDGLNASLAAADSLNPTPRTINNVTTSELVGSQKKQLKLLREELGRDDTFRDAIGAFGETLGL